MTKLNLQDLRSDAAAIAEHRGHSEIEIVHLALAWGQATKGKRGLGYLQTDEEILEARLRELPIGHGGTPPVSLSLSEFLLVAGRSPWKLQTMLIDALREDDLVKETSRTANLLSLAFIALVVVAGFLFLTGNTTFEDLEIGDCIEQPEVKAGGDVSRFVNRVSCREEAWSYRLVSSSRCSFSSGSDERLWRISDRGRTYCLQPRS